MADPPGQVIRILLLEDEAMVRESLAHFLQQQAGLEVAAQCGTVAEALLVTATGMVDLVLLDANLGAERWVDYLERAHGAGFRGPVLGLTAGTSPDERSALEACGVSGIVSKQSSLEELIDAIRAACRRQSERTGAPAADLSPLPPRGALSPRDMELLRLVAEGLTSKEIASRIRLSETSVKAALRSLFRKTGARNRSQLVRLALERYGDRL